MNEWNVTLNNSPVTTNTHYERSIAMPLPKQHQDYTTEYIYSLPDGQRAELIDGQVYMMAPPSRKLSASP